LYEVTAVPGAKQQVQQENPSVCLNASPTAIAHVIATLSDLMPAHIGMRSRT